MIGPDVAGSGETIGRMKPYYCKRHGEQRPFVQTYKNGRAPSRSCPVCRRDSARKLTSVRSVCHPELNQRARGKCWRCYRKDHENVDAYNTRARTYYSKDPIPHRIAARARGWRRKYNITPEQYVAMLREQDGKCAVCLESPKGERLLCVDHDHVTGAVRQLLCVPCNVAVGWLEKQGARIKAAETYIARHRP